jgi:hypothetical protein
VRRCINLSFGLQHTNRILITLTIKSERQCRFQANDERSRRNSRLRLTKMAYMRLNMLRLAANAR